MILNSNGVKENIQCVFLKDMEGYVNKITKNHNSVCGYTYILHYIKENSEKCVLNKYGAFSYKSNIFTFMELQ